MSYEFILAALFFFIGLIVGAVTIGIIMYRMFLMAGHEDHAQEPVDDDKEDKRFIEVQEIDLSGVFKEQLKKGQVVHVEKLASLKEFKKQITKRAETAKENEEYLTLQHLTRLNDTVDAWYEDRKQWFLERIGKKIRPSDILCDCNDCKEMAQNGAVIENEFQALSFFMNECRSILENKEITYHDYE